MSDRNRIGGAVPYLTPDGMAVYIDFPRSGRLAQLVRALLLQSRCQRFESSIAH